MGKRWRALRWPVALLVVALVLVLVATVLDTGSARSRDVALLLGAPALYVLLPVAVVWAAVALVLQRRRPP